MYNESGIKTFLAGEDLEARRLVKVESGTVTDPPEVIYADAGEDAIGVTEAAADDGSPVAVRMLNMAGTFEIECLVAAAIARGTSLYAGANGVVTDDSSGSVLGIAMETGVDNAYIEVAIDNRKPTTAAGTTLADADGNTTEATVEAALAEIYAFVPTVIADPGDGGAIPVTRSGVCALTTGAVAETRTLADPDQAGLQLTVTLDVDEGGDAVVTAATAINDTGNNTITLADAGETITLVATQIGSSPVWRLVENDGAALSTA